MKINLCSLSRLKHDFINHGRWLFLLLRTNGNNFRLENHLSMPHRKHIICYPSTTTSGSTGDNVKPAFTKLHNNKIKCWMISRILHVNIKESMLKITRCNYSFSCTLTSVIRMSYQIDVRRRHIVYNIYVIQRCIENWLGDSSRKISK